MKIQKWLPLLANSNKNISMDFNSFERPKPVVLFLVYIALIFISYALHPLEHYNLVSLHGALAFISGLLFKDRSTSFLVGIFSYIVGFNVIELSGVGYSLQSTLANSIYATITFSPIFLSGCLAATYKGVTSLSYLKRMRNVAYSLVTVLILVSLCQYYTLKLGGYLASQSFNLEEIFVRSVLIHVPTITVIVPFMYLLLAKPYDEERLFNNTDKKYTLASTIAALLCSLVVLYIEGLPSYVISPVVLSLSILSIGVSSLNSKPVRGQLICLVWVLFISYFVSKGMVFSAVGEGYLRLAMFHFTYSMFCLVALGVSIKSYVFRRYARTNSNIRKNLATKNLAKTKALQDANENLLVKNKELKRQQTELDKLAHWDSELMLPNRNKARAVVQDLLDNGIESSILLITLSNYRQVLFNYGNTTTRKLLLSLSGQIRHALKGVPVHHREDSLYRWSKDSLLIVAPIKSLSSLNALGADFIAKKDLVIDSHPATQIPTKLSAVGNTTSEYSSSRPLFDDLYESLEVYQNEQRPLWFGESVIERVQASQLLYSNLIHSLDSNSYRVHAIELCGACSGTEVVLLNRHEIYFGKESSFVKFNDLTFLSFEELILKTRTQYMLQLEELFSEANDKQILIGVSIEELMDTDFKDQLKRLRNKHRSQLYRIVIVIQRVCGDIELIKSEVIEDYKQMGFKVGINLSQGATYFLKALSELDLDYVYLDSLLKEMVSNKSKADIMVKSVVHVAKQLGFKVVGLKVADDAVAQRILQYGVDDVLVIND